MLPTIMMVKDDYSKIILLAIFLLMQIAFLIYLFFNKPK